MVVLQGVSGYGKKFKMAELNDSPCSTDHDEYLDPLEIAAIVAARLSTPEKARTSRQRKVQTNPAETKKNVRGSVDPNVTSLGRVKEFKDQCLTVVLDFGMWLEKR